MLRSVGGGQLQRHCALRLQRCRLCGHDIFLLSDILLALSGLQFGQALVIFLRHLLKGAAWFGDIELWLGINIKLFRAGFQCDCLSQRGIPVRVPKEVTGAQFEPSMSHTHISWLLPERSDSKAILFPSGDK